MFKVEILGGVGEYGRNCFYIENRGHAILLDCGVLNNEENSSPDLTQAHVANLDAVLISHSHKDHVGALPMLIGMGYSGDIFMSKMTAKQLKQSYKNIKIFQPETIETWVRVNDYLEFQWGYSGHLVGSVWYNIRFFEKVIFFSGDYVSDSYLLKATLPRETGTTYNLALIDSGHIEKKINNLDVLEQMKDYINENLTFPIIFPSSLSGKTADIATYLFQNTAREVNIDQEYFSFLKDYYDSPDNLLPTMYESFERMFKGNCFRERAESNNAIFLVPEMNEWRIEKLLQENPQAIVIFTGYLKESRYFKKIAENENQSKHFFYKTHLDYDDIVEFTKKINATEIIYFHSKLITM